MCGYIVPVMPLHRTIRCYICSIVPGDALSGQRLLVHWVGTWCMGTYIVPISIVPFLTQTRDASGSFCSERSLFSKSVTLK